MVQNAISIVGVLQVSLWLTCTTAGERFHNRTIQKSSPNMDPGDHTALNKFIEDVLKAQDELADIRTMDTSGVHKPQKVGYPSGVSTGVHAHPQKSYGSASVHNDLNIIASAHGKETPSSNQLKTHDKIEFPQNADTHTMNGKNGKLVQSKNDPLLIKTRGGGKMSRNIASNHRKQSYQQNLDSNEDDVEMLKYLTSNFPKGNRFLQQGQMQEKQTDTDRLSQIFSAMKKNYFPNTAAVKPENTRDNSDESKFDQSNAEGNDKVMLYEDLLHLGDKQIDAGNEPMQTSVLEYKQLDDKDAIQHKGRYASHLEGKALDEQDALGNEQRFRNHLEDDRLDWKDTFRNEPSYIRRLGNTPLDENDGVRRERTYAHDFQDKALGEQYGVGNELRYARYLKSKPLDTKFNVGNEPSYASNLEDKHVNNKEALENELGYSRSLEDRLDIDSEKHFHSRPRTRSDNAEDQLAEVYPNAHKTSDQEGEDPAVVKYFQTHGRRHNRNAHPNSFVSDDNGCVRYANSEENVEPPDENTKLKQAHERLQLEDADGLLVGMHARIGTTDNQMELENVNQDKVVPKHEEEEDIQQQLEEEKLIFYPYVPGQTPALSILTDENNRFTNEQDQKSGVSPDSSSSNSMSQVNSEALNHFQQVNGGQIAGENKQISQENDITEVDDGNGQIKEDSNISDDYNFEPILSQSSDVSKNSGYYEENISPVQRQVHQVNKRSIERDPQLVQHLIMDESQEVYPRYNLRHLLDFEGDADKRTILEQVYAKEPSVRNALAHSNIEEQERYTVDESNEKTYLGTESPSFSDASQRHRRAVVKRPGAIWLEEDSDAEYEEKGEGEEEANQEETELGSNTLEVNAAKHGPLQPPVKYQTRILDSNIAFRPTTDNNVPAKRRVEHAHEMKHENLKEESKRRSKHIDATTLNESDSSDDVDGGSEVQSNVPAKRRVEDAHEMKNGNLKEESKRKRRSKNNPANDATTLNESDSSDDVDSDNEVQMSEDFKDKETDTNQGKREEGWHKKLKGLENKYRNFKDNSKQTLIAEKMHRSHIGKNKVVEAKHQVSLSQEKESSGVNHLFDATLRSDAHRIKPGSDDELEEYNDDAEQDSYKDRNTKLKGTNVRSLLEKTSKDYEDVTKELKQVMKSLVTQGKSRKGFVSGRAGDSLCNGFEAQNSVPLEVVKLGRPSLKEEYQNQPLAENNDEGDHVSVGHHSQSSNVNLADCVENEEKEHNLKMEYQSLPRKKKEVLDSDVDRDAQEQSKEEGLNKKLDHFDVAESMFGLNSKRDLSGQLRGAERPVSKSKRYQFGTCGNDPKSRVAVNPESKSKLHPFKMSEYFYKSAPTEDSESLEAKTKLTSDVQSSMTKEIGNGDNLSAGMFNGDESVGSNYIARREHQLNNDDYDALNESPLNNKDYLDNGESRTHYLNSDVQKKRNNVQHSRNIPQELLDISSVSTWELDRLISEGNLPVLKRVKRSHNDSVPLDDVASKNVVEESGEVYNHERKMDNGQNVGINGQEQNTFNVPCKSEFRKEESPLFKKSLEENKNKETNQNQEETRNSRNADDYEKAKRETKEKYNFLKIRDTLSEDKNKPKSVNFANGHAEELSELSEDDGVIQQTSQSGLDNTKSINGIENHFLNKREAIHNKNLNVHTANTIHFSNKRNPLGNRYMKNVNKIYHNSVEEKRMPYGEMRRNTVSDRVGHSLVHGKYGVNVRRQDQSRSQGRKSDNLKEELDPYSASKLSHQNIRSKMDIDYKTKHRKEKAVHALKPSRRGSASADSGVLHHLPDQQSDNGMLYDNTPSQISNQGYSKLRSMKPESSIQDNSLVDIESFGNDLPDYVTDDKSSTAHGARLSKNAHFVDTLAHLSRGESQKQSSSTADDYGWNAQIDEREMPDTLYENLDDENALSNGNFRKSRGEAEDATSKHSLLDDLYRLNNEKESARTQYHSKFSSGTKNNQHYLNIDNLPSDHYSEQPVTGNKEETSYRFPNYDQGHSAENTESGVSFLENNQNTDSVSNLFGHRNTDSGVSFSDNNLHTDSTPNLFGHRNTDSGVSFSENNQNTDSTPSLFGHRNTENGVSFSDNNLHTDSTPNLFGHRHTESGVPFLDNNLHTDSTPNLFGQKNAESGVSFLDNNLHTDSTPNLFGQKNAESGVSLLDNNLHTDSTSNAFRPYDVSSFGHSETNNLPYQNNMHSSQNNYLRPGEYDIFPTVSLRAKQPTRCVTKTSTCFQPAGDSIPLFPVVDQKHSKAYNGELDDGLLGMNIVDTILNQVYGSKNLQHHIGPGLHRNFTPTKIDQMNSQSRARQKMISQISTIIDKGLDEERKQKACVQLPACLQKFLDWLVKDDTCPSTHRAHSQPNVHPFYTCDQHHTSPSQQQPSDLQKKYLLLKKLTDEYDKLPECEKSQVQNVHEVLCTETNIVNKLLEDEELSKKTCLNYASRASDGAHAADCTDYTQGADYTLAADNTPLVNLSCSSSETEYNLPVLNYEGPVSPPCENESQFDQPTTFVLPIPDALCNDSKLDQHTGDEDNKALISEDLECLGLPQHAGCGSCNKGDHNTVKTNRDSHTSKHSFVSPKSYNFHDGLTKEEWMNDFERTRVGDDGHVSRRSYMDASTLNGKLHQGQMSNSRWSPEYRYNHLDSRNTNGAQHRREFSKNVDGDYAEHERPNSPLRGTSHKRSRYLGNDQGEYYDGVYQAGRERPDRSHGGRKTHVSNEYRRLLARAEQIRRKRSRGENSRDTSW